jgi:hypothetical protein
MPNSITPAEAANAGIGGYGFDRITAGNGLDSADTLCYWWLIVADGVESTITATSALGDGLTNSVIEAEKVRMGCFKTVDVSVGAVLAYRRPI